MEHTVSVWSAEAHGKDGQGVIPVEPNTASTAEQTLDCLPVERIAEYLQKRKNRSLEEDKSKKQIQSARTRSMSLRRDLEQKKKTK